MQTPPHLYTDAVSSSSIPAHLYSLDKQPSLEELKKLCSRQVPPGFYPLATTIASNIPIYNLSSFSKTSESISALQKEWHHILLSGPGVFVARHMYSPSAVEEANTTFQTIIDSEKALKPNNSNKDWVWNIFSKHCLQDPSSFYSYYSNAWLQHISSMWLGPNYQITAQVNNVGPGGEAQHPHRDYHLGFLSPAQLSQVPIATQLASQLLTLQGAIAHSDMPTGTGSTRLLPFSQTFQEGFIAFKRPEFAEYFAQNWVSLELQIGDGIFFSPAIYHAAGANSSNAQENFIRKANLLQISSAYGRPMEMVESIPLIERSWDVLSSKYADEGEQSERVEAFVKAVAKGYNFPTNLDRRIGGPVSLESEQQVVLMALKEGWGKDKVMAVLKKMGEDSRA
jgi:ectoine hydroxylase-related dioxygenase (phytanoyl-CoA dioxygenase family)